MALTVKDRIWTRVNSSGLGNLIVGDAQPAYSGWESVSLGDTVYYCLVDGVSWEVGHGQYIESDSKQQITRNVLDSNASGNGGKIDIASSKSATVFCTYPADKSVYLDLDNNIEFPNSNAVLKYIAGIQVTAPAVVTEAVIVDGEAGADGDLAGLLNVYHKDEIDDQQEVQDVQIEKNKQNIIELEEEIEALAPSFDRGDWDYQEPSNPENMPAEGTYFILDDSENSITDFANAHEVLFSNKDVHDITHTWSNVEVGQYLELFDSVDSEFLLAKIEKITVESGAIRLEVTVEQSEGGAGGGSPRVRIKIFEIPEVDISTLMPKSGGTFTGDVKHKKDIIIEPSLPNRFVTIKNRYATNADGTSAGSNSTQFGVNFDLDHGNSGYNTVKWSNRYGNILAVYGGTRPNAKYTGETTEGSHLVNKEYADNSVLKLCTLQTSGNSYAFDNGLSAPTDTSFRSESTSLQYNKKFHLKKLYTSEGANAFLKDYKATPSTMFEIYERGVLQLRTSIKNFIASDRGNNSMMFDVSGTGASVHNYSSLVSNNSYQVILTNMVKV